MLDCPKEYQQGHGLGMYCESIFHKTWIKLIISSYLVGFKRMTHSLIRKLKEGGWITIDRLSHLHIVIVMWFDKSMYELRRSRRWLSSEVEEAMVSTNLNRPCSIMLTLGKKWKDKIVKTIGYEEVEKTTTLVCWNPSKYCDILEYTKVILL
jgi:hypothetical protein